MGETKLDILREQLKNYKIEPKKMTVDELRDALIERYDLQSQVILYTSFLMQQQGKKENQVLKKEISLLKGFSRSVRNEGNLYNRITTKNPVFSEQEIMSEEDAKELVEKCNLFESCAQLFSNRAKEQEQELLKVDKVSQFLHNQRSVSTSRMVVSSFRRSIKKCQSHDLVSKISQMALEEEGIVDKTATNMKIVGLNDRIVQFYKLIRYRQLANRYRREKCSITQESEYPTYKEDTDLLLMECAKAENTFRGYAEDIEDKPKKYKS